MVSRGYPASPEQVPVHLRGNRSAVTRWFRRTVLSVFGWHVQGRIPNVKRLLIIVAPHTSNWDFVFAMAAILGLNLRVRWMGKHTIFKFGVTWFMRWLGGIPTDRGKPEQLVRYVADLSDREDGIAIGMAPEGTRSKVTRWKTGFLRIAKLIDCPILLVGLDFKGKRFVIDNIYLPYGDNEQDIAALTKYYSRYHAKHPEKY